MSESPIKLFNSADAAAMLGVQESTLEKWRRTRAVELPFIRFSAKCVRYELGELRRFMQAHTYAAAASTR